jgi:hypothetical protein
MFFLFAIALGIVGFVLKAALILIGAAIVLWIVFTIIGLILQILAGLLLGIFGH